MDAKLGSVISKVQKLLTLSKSASPEEAATAAAIANKLIDEYRLSEIDLAVDAGESDPLMEDNGFIYETGRIIPWKKSLVGVLCQHYGVANFNDNDYPNGRLISRFKLLGRKSDIAITRYMFTWLLAECQRLADSEAKGKGRIFVASYCQGFVAGIKAQLAKSRNEARVLASSQAMVKLDSRLDEARAFMYSKYNLRNAKASSASQIDANAYYSGKSRGDSIHLGAVIGGSSTKLLGN
ncbi:Domain of unknown function DUF2786 [uncultured Caudovirales phage]|uniref:Uncharacterized protein n=1 Tax=uncultured Caudovirales phage TaxID=2100421 RepID=A0A6J5RXH3_9CAUD|nr:Domain of unknown function DUF2786 [uncultured Caudovirales phage]